MKYFFFLFFVIYSVFGQSSLQGIVKNEEDKPLNNISVILKNDKKQTIGYQFTKADGSFLFKNLENQIYHLQFNSLDYEKYFVETTVGNNEEATIEVVLAKKTELLKEIVIDVPRSIRESNDTIFFNAKSFITGKEANVEDLLKKLPGVEVTEQGVIKVGNKEIEKIMVEGDDFFEKGYKLLSKNMDVAALEEVQVLKNYSNNKHMKGIENSDKVAINLTLQDGFKRKWFGNVEAGYDVTTANSYFLRNNLMSFGKKNKYYFLTSLNNIGVEAMGDLAALIFSATGDDIETITETSYKKLELPEHKASLKDTKTRFNNEELVSLNSIFTPSEKSKLKVLLFFNTDENNFYKNSFESYKLGDTQFQNTEDFFTRKKRLTTFGRIDFTQDFSKKSTLEVSSRFSYSQSKEKSAALFNSDPLNETLQNRSNYANTQIKFTHKPAENKVWIFATNYIYNAIPQNYFLNKFIYTDLFTDKNSENVYQDSENKMQLISGKTQYIQKYKNNDLFEFLIDFAHKKDYLKTSFYLLEDGEKIIPNGFYNDFVLADNSLKGTVKYTHLLSSNMNIAPSFAIKYLNQKINVEDFSKQPSVYQPLLLLPQLSWEWKINKKNMLRLDYKYTWRTSEVFDLQPNYIHTSFRNFSKGYEQFTRFGNQKATLLYTLGNWTERYFLSAFVSYSYADKYFSNKSSITPNYSLSEYIILQNKNSWLANISTDYYLQKIRTNLKVNTSIYHSRYQNLVNTQLRDITTVNQNLGIELRSSFSGKFNYHLGSKWEYVKFATESTSAYTNKRYFLNLDLDLSSKVSATIQNECYHFDYLKQQKNYFLFTYLSINYKKSDKVNYKLSVNNLFDTNKFVSYQLSDISSSETQYKLIGRYFLLRIDFKL